MEHNLILRPTGKFGSRGERYEVVFDGEVLLTSNAPEFAACRILQARGIGGAACFWRDGKPNWDVRMNVTAGATKAIMENAKNGPRVVKWAPFADREDAEA